MTAGVGLPSSEDAPAAAPRGLRQAAAFIAVGAAATAVYLGAGSGFVALGLPAASASLAAFGLATCVSYVGHRRFTFRIRTDHRQSVPRFLATHGLGAGLAWAVPWVLAHVLGLPPFIAFVVTGAAIAFLSFFALKLLVFAGGDDACDPDTAARCGS